MDAALPTLPPNRAAITLEASQQFMSWGMPIASIFLILGLLLIVAGRWAVGTSGLLLGGLAAWRGSMMQRPGSTYLSLDAENLTVSTNYKNHTIPWSDIKSIEAAWTGGERFQISWNKLVKIELIQTAGTFERLIGTNVLWIYPRLYGMNAEGLITQMEPYLTDSRRRG